MYKLIAVDMDGTLLKNDRTISTRTKIAIKLAQQKGIKIVLATGRPSEGIQKYLKELNLINEDDYSITFNGALVQNTKTKEIISRNTLNIEDFNYLYKLGKSLNIDMHAFTSKGLITPKMNKYTELEIKGNGISAKEVDFSSLSKDTELIKFMMVGEGYSIDEIYKKLPKEVFLKYSVVRSSPVFLEFLNKSGNKGESVKKLASYLNIDIKEVICIGDAGNDYHMIKYAGLGVAMENSFAEIKEIADYITKTNEEDGVAHVIDKFILAV